MAKASNRPGQLATPRSAMTPELASNGTMVARYGWTRTRGSSSRRLTRSICDQAGSTSIRSLNQLHPGNLQRIECHCHCQHHARRHGELCPASSCSLPARHVLPLRMNCVADQLLGIVRRRRSRCCPLKQPFNRFFEDNFARLYRFAVARLSDDPEGAREVVQITLTRAVRKMHTFRAESALFTWLCAICGQVLGEGTLCRSILMTKGL